jgi:cleavage and polyadenylation specificity factor subunit 3
VINASPLGRTLKATEESSRTHMHHHSPPGRNPHANLTPEERFSRLCMFLEAQFGPQVTPITRPKVTMTPLKPHDDDGGIKAEPHALGMAEVEEELADLEAAELERLHMIGIPVPGVQIVVDHHVATVWLETLEVECAWALLRDRVKAVVERAVETVAPLWGQQNN